MIAAFLGIIFGGWAPENRFAYKLADLCFGPLFLTNCPEVRIVARPQLGHIEYVGRSNRSTNDCDVEGLNPPAIARPIDSSHLLDGAWIY